MNKPWHTILPHLGDAPASAFDVERSAAVLNALKPVQRWDSVVVAVYVRDDTGVPSAIVPGVRPAVPGCMYLFLNDAAVASVFGEGGMQATVRYGVEVKAGRLISLLMQGYENRGRCGGFFVYGVDGDVVGEGGGVPRFLATSALEPLADTLSAIVLLARAKAGQVTSADVRDVLGERVLFYSGKWLADGEQLEARESGGESVVSLFLSPTALLAARRASAGTAKVDDTAMVNGVANFATITLNEAFARLPEGAHIVIEPGMGYELTLRSS